MSNFPENLKKLTTALKKAKSLFVDKLTMSRAVNSPFILPDTKDLIFAKNRQDTLSLGGSNVIKKHYHWLLLLLLVMFLSFPTYYAYTNTPEEKVFSGQAFKFDQDDINVYFSIIHWSQKYKLNFQNQYTTELQKSIIFYPFYTLIGTIFPNTSVFLLYHLMVFVFSFILAFIIYHVYLGYLKNRLLSLIAVFMTFLGGGLGLFFWNTNIISADFYSPVTFLSTLQKPHEILAVIFSILAFINYYQFLRNRRNKNLLLSCLYSDLVFIFYPYYILNFYLIFVIWALVDASGRQSIKSLLLFIVLTLPLASIYSFYLLNAGTMKDVIKPDFKNLSLIQIILGYGVLWIFILREFFSQKRNKPEKYIIIIFIVNLIVSFMPVSISKYFLRGMYFPAVLLSLIQAKKLIAKNKTVYIPVVTIVFSLVCSYGLFLTLDRITTAKRGQDRLYYLSESEDKVIELLKNNSINGSGVLANSTFSNIIPAHTYNKVYAGHAYQTPDAENKLVNIAEFYQKTIEDDKALNFLSDNNIIYVNWGQAEKEIAGREENLEYPFLKNIYRTEEIIIYKIQK